MSQSAAYALKASLDLDAVGSVFVHDRLEVNIREELENGGGYVVSDQPAVIARLDTVDALKRVSLEEAQSSREKKAPEKKATPKTEN